MLAALLENNNNTRPAAGSSFRVDPRSSGGRSRTDRLDDGTRFELVDIAVAMAAFPEIAGEHPGARAARRLRWISEALPAIKEAREKREAAAFLVGAQLADAAAEERHAAQDQLKVEQIVQIIDEVREASRPVSLPARPTRGGGSGIGLFIGGLVIGGVLVGIALRKQPRRGS